MRERLLERRRARSTGTRRSWRTATRRGSRGSTPTGAISRQRYFGVPVPGLVRGGRRRRGRPRPAAPPDEDAPAGRPLDRRPRRLRAEQRGEPGGFVGRPRRHGHLGDELAHPPDRRRLGRRRRTCSHRVFPMDLRPQGPEIIRTWLFSTVVRSELEHGRAAVAPRDDQRLGPRPGPQEDVEVLRARLDARWSCSRRSAPTACATGRRRGAPAPTPPRTRRR